MTPFAVLTLIRDTLATIPGVATCAIGLEANITPADYPLIRVAPTRLTLPDGVHRRETEVLIYYGAALLEASDGLTAVYETLLGMETAIIDQMLFALVASSQGAFLQPRFVETLTDEDRLPLYKLFASRFTVEG